MTVSAQRHDASHRNRDHDAPVSSHSPVPDSLAAQTLGVGKRFGSRAA